MIWVLVTGCGGDEPDVPNGDCIMGVAVDFSSGASIRDESTVADVFSQFVQSAQQEGVPIFGDAYGNRWRFEAAVSDRVFEGISYWRVTASWFSEADGQWRQKNVFHVSEHGDVVRLLGCI